MATLIFGSPDSEFVSASFGGRPFPDAEDSFSRNQVTVQLDVAVRPFRASFEAMWIVESLPRFRSALEHIYGALEGEVRFEPDYERTLEMSLMGDGLGHFTIRGNICVNPMGGPWFKFELPTIDQTYLPDMISAFLDLESEYPIL